MTRKVTILTVTAVLLVAVSGHGQGPVPLGDDFQINTYTTGGQGGPAVALADNGEFVVVWGSADQLIPPVYARHWQALLPRVRCQEIQGAGHMLQAEQPEVVAESIVKFLV